MFFFFYFRQKTAYEVRISDWSSDVCSSDLAGVVGPGGAQQACRGGDPREPGDLPVDLADASRLRLQRVGLHLRRLQQHVHVLHRAESSETGRASCRERVCQYVSISVVDVSLKKKIQTTS